METNRWIKASHIACTRLVDRNNLERIFALDLKLKVPMWLAKVYTASDSQTLIVAPTLTAIRDFLITQNTSMRILAVEVYGDYNEEPILQGHALQIMNEILWHAQADISVLKYYNMEEG